MKTAKEGCGPSSALSKYPEVVMYYDILIIVPHLRNGADTRLQTAGCNGGGAMRLGHKIQSRATTSIIMTNRTIPITLIAFFTLFHPASTESLVTVSSGYYVGAIHFHSPGRNKHCHIKNKKINREYSHIDKLSQNAADVRHQHNPNIGHCHLCPHNGL